LIDRLTDPLDDAELDELDRFLLDRMTDEEGDAIAAADGDEGILDVSELDGFLTAVISGPNTIPPSRWLPAIWGEAQPTWASKKKFEHVFQLLMRHYNSIVSMLMHYPEEYEPLILEREVEGRTYMIVDQWSVGYMRGVALDADAWNAGGADVDLLMRPIRLWGTEEGWKQIDAMSDKDQEREQHAIFDAVRAVHKYWLERRAISTAPVRRDSPKVGRNDPCPCGSGKKYKHCCGTAGTIH